MKFSQEKLALSLGISRGLLNNWENGDRQPTLAGIVSLADFFETSVDYLLGRTDNRERTE